MITRGRAKAKKMCRVGQEGVLVTASLALRLAFVFRTIHSEAVKMLAF